VELAAALVMSPAGPAGEDTDPSCARLPIPPARRLRELGDASTCRRALLLDGGPPATLRCHPRSL
jgi:hypothetical protein